MNQHSGEEFSTLHWSGLHGDSLGQGRIKSVADDFIVEEQLGFELSGEGEHHLLWVEKTNTNTAFVAEQLAAFSGISLRDISYAGRKDKFARTRQFFSVYQGKHPCPDWQKFEHSNIRILSTTRHNKKLRTGALQGNKFSLIIRDLANINEDSLAQRLQDIQQCGVPNYFGQQRFGEMHTKNGIILNGNLALGMRMCQGEKINNRNKRSMAISALRSYLFNEVVSHRLSEKLHTSCLLGDALQLSGSNSYFVVSAEDDMNSLSTRLQSKDIQITAPLIGSGAVVVKDDAKKLEDLVLNRHADIVKVLSSVGLKHERRPIVVYPKDMHWTLTASKLTLSFTLPSGCFATAVIREILDTSAQQNAA